MPPIPHPLGLIGATTVFEPALRWSLTLAIFPPPVNCKNWNTTGFKFTTPPPFFSLVAYLVAPQLNLHGKYMLLLVHEDLTVN